MDASGDWCVALVSAQQMLVEKQINGSTVLYVCGFYVFVFAFQRTDFWSPYILDYIKLGNSDSFGNFLQFIPLEVVSEVPVHLSKAQNEICC